MRLIDLDSDYIQETLYRRAFKTRQDIEEWLNNAPTIDAVPVVRCRDCKHFMEYTREYAQTTEGADGDCYIKLMNSYDKQYFACTYDDFCSYGERKEGDG